MKFFNLLQKPGVLDEKRKDSVWTRKKRSDSLSSRHRNRISQTLNGSSLQPNLTVSKPNDPDEQEAEHVEQRAKSLNGRLSSLVKQTTGHTPENARIHTGSKAEVLSTSYNARAVTIGKDIYFNRNQYQPDTTEGQKLLAHELTHVAQQRTGSDRVMRDPQEGETSQKDQLRRQVLNLIPRVIRRLRYSIIRGYGGLYGFETQLPDGRIEHLGAAPEQETLSSRRERLQHLVTDLEALKQVLQQQNIPEDWMPILAEEEEAEERNPMED